ncbi:uncharacterized protein LOC116618769 isoform X2 [Nematostella vectensis]|uniref:uncharacterized protein LOC116618769 isoform X2 n=1 Tax=Nematostella vectensis TaxID=45351 RepID=UPI0020770E9A|nr:uncharacterized protein LOC116618769 isoform X2 [Nematostella vectensis]
MASSLLKFLACCMLLASTIGASVVKPESRKIDHLLAKKAGTTTSHPTDPTGFSEAQLSVIGKTVSDALASWRPPQQDTPSPPVVASEGTPGSASPLGLDRPLDEALEGKITRAPSIAPKTALLVNTASPHTAHRAFIVTTCASTSTESPSSLHLPPRLPKMRRLPSRSPVSRRNLRRPAPRQQKPSSGSPSCTVKGRQR